MLATADTLGHKLVVLGAGTANEIDTAFEATAQRVDTLSPHDAFLLPQSRSGASPSPAEIYAFRGSAKARSLLTVSGVATVAG